MTIATTLNDSVDEMIADYNRVMPGLDVSSLHVVSRMLRLIRLFERDRARILESVGLEPWLFDMLAFLRRNPDNSATPGELMTSALVTSGTMTARLKALETRGWITRTRDGGDRRQIIVELTIPGRELFDRVFGDALECQTRLIACLSEEERGQLTSAFRKMLAHNESR